MRRYPVIAGKDKVLEPFRGDHAGTGGTSAVSYDRPVAGSVRISKVHHACVVIDDGITRLLLDPGRLGPAAPLAGVDAVLITHGHFDHLDPDLIHRAIQRGIPVWAPADALDHLGRGGEGLHEAVAGETLRVGTAIVTVAGNRHAEVHPELAGPENRAYLISHAVFVTGDEHALPPGPFSALVTPIDAPWLRATDLIRYVRTVRPRQVVGVHDGLLNADGLAVARSVAASLQNGTVTSSLVLADGATVAAAEAE